MKYTPEESTKLTAEWGRYQDSCRAINLPPEMRMSYTAWLREMQLTGKAYDILHNIQQ